MTEAARGYLDLLGGSRLPPQQWLRALAEALDHLVVAVVHTPKGEPSGKHEPPQREGQFELALAPAYRRLLSHYTTVTPKLDPDQDLLTGDAYDDVRDIARDLSEVLWRRENNGAEDAAWHFHFLYEIHWGRHLHDLRSHLHWLLHEKERDGG